MEVNFLSSEKKKKNKKTEKKEKIEWLAPENEKIEKKTDFKKRKSFSFFKKIFSSVIKKTKNKERKELKGRVLNRTRNKMLKEIQKEKKLSVNLLDNRINEKEIKISDKSGIEGSQSNKENNLDDFEKDKEKIFLDKQDSKSMSDYGKHEGNLVLDKDINSGAENYDQKKDRSINKDKQEVVNTFLKRIKIFFKNIFSGNNKKLIKNKNGKFSNLNTNLIKDELVIFIDWKRNVIIISIFALLSFALVGASYGGLHYWGQKKQSAGNDFDQKFNELDKKIKEAEIGIEEALIFKNKLALAGELLNTHVYWTNFFNFLEENTLKNVYYLGFSGSNDGEYVLKAGARDFASLEAQIKKMLSNEYVLSASIEKGQFFQNKQTGEMGVGFDMAVVIDKKIFTP